MEVLLATSNKGKVSRFARQIRGVDSCVQLYTPSDLGVVGKVVSEDSESLMENAEEKAQSFAGLVSLPVLANDTGFWVAGEGLVSTPKRIALGGRLEVDLDQATVAACVLEYWKKIASKYGGEVEAAWVEAFVVLYPDGTIERAESRREIILTNQEFEVPVPEMPIRALYRSKITGKPAAKHNHAEEWEEFAPVRKALVKVLRLQTS